MNFENPDVCRRCGGLCCQAAPGICEPADFGHDPGRVARALASGLYAIDWLEARRPGYYVRPAAVNALGDLFDASWGGTCVFWAPDTGCRLPLRRRPAQFRRLEPRPGVNCVDHGPNKPRAARLWHRWRPIFEAWRHDDDA